MNVQIATRDEIIRLRNPVSDGVSDQLISQGNLCYAKRVREVRVVYGTLYDHPGPSHSTG